MQKEIHSRVIFAGSWSSGAVEPPCLWAVHYKCLDWPSHAFHQNDHDKKEHCKSSSKTFLQMERGFKHSVSFFFFHRVLTELVSKMRDMQMDKTELGCLRAIVLFNPGDILDTHHLLVNLCFFLLTNLIPFSCSLSLSCSTFFSILPFFSTWVDHFTYYSRYTVYAK